MRRLIILSASLALAIAASAPANAQKLDKNGRCHAANGEFAKASVCGGPAARSSRSATRSTEVAPAAAIPPLRAPAPTAERCKDDKGRFAKCGTKGAHPA